MPSSLYNLNRKIKYWKVCISLQLAWEALGLSQLLFGELSLIIGPVIVKMQKSMKMLLIANAVQLAQCGQYNTEIYTFVWRLICFLMTENTFVTKLQQNVTFVTALKAENLLLS